MPTPRHELIVPSWTEKASKRRKKNTIILSFFSPLLMLEFVPIYIHVLFFLLLCLLVLRPCSSIMPIFLSMYRFRNELWFFSSLLISFVSCLSLIFLTSPPQRRWLL